MLASVLEQVKEPIQILQDQAQLTRDEHAHRVEAERRADEAERLAAERVAQSQRQAQARIAEVEREAEAKIAKNREEADERHNTLSRSSKALAGELEDVTKERDVLLTERSALEQQVKAEIRERFRLSALARASGDRLTDIPMPEVMERLGYEGESRGGQYTYPGSDGRAALIIQGQKAYDSKGELICRNSMDLVVFMRRENEGVEGFTKMRALAWLRDEFGGPRAAAAYLVNQEQHLHNIFARDHAGREREQGEPDRGSGPWRAGSEVGQEPERTSPGHDTPSHGYDFGR